MKIENFTVGKRTLTWFSAPHGFILYRGVVILWDEPDERVVTLIDSLPLEERKNLVAVEKHEGDVRFAWRYSVPTRFELERSVEVDSGGGHSDSWVVDGAFEASAPA